MQLFPTLFLRPTRTELNDFQHIADLLVFSLLDHFIGLPHRAFLDVVPVALNIYLSVYKPLHELISAGLGEIC